MPEAVSGNGAAEGTRSVAGAVVGEQAPCLDAVGQGKKVPEVAKAIGISEVSYDRRRKEFGGLSVPQAKRLNDLERENARLRRAVFERRACKALGQHRSSQRHQPQMRADEDALTAAIVALASRFGRHGYRRITELLQMAGWSVNAKRVRRIWRAECLKVPSRQPKRGRLGLADGPCIRLRPERSNHVRAYAFVSKTTHDSRKLRLLTVIDEHTRECRAIRAAPHQPRRALHALRALPRARPPGAHSLRQRTRVRCYRDTRVAHGARGNDLVHRTRLTLGERLHRILQRQAA